MCPQGYDAGSMKPGDLVYVKTEFGKPREVWIDSTWRNVDTCGSVSDGDVGLFLFGPIPSDHPGDIKRKISFVLCLFGEKLGWVYPEILRSVDTA